LFERTIPLGHKHLYDPILFSHPSEHLRSLHSSISIITEKKYQKQPIEVFCKLTVMHLPGSLNLGCQELNNFARKLENKESVKIFRNLPAEHINIFHEA